MSATILVINAGSSSIKFELFELASGDPSSILSGQLDGIGTRPHLKIRTSDGTNLVDATQRLEDAPDVERAQALLGSWLAERLGGPPSAVGHRVVHGGPDHAAPALVTDDLLADLERLVPLAPLHQPNNLAPIRSIRARLPDVPQVACFDTAFHRQHPPLADRFAIPEALYAEGVRRYGFHGLSYEYIAGRLPDMAPPLATGRVVVAHLGSGASMCALVAGRSVENTMGFTALDGLPMGTRTGQLDPGVILYLLTEKGMEVGAVQHLLYHECGLRGLSGVSSDVRDLLASSAPGARLALDYLAYRAAMAVGSLSAAMGGLDGLVFTAGVGENAPSIRAAIIERLGWLGLDLDAGANAKHGPLLTTRESRIAAYVIPTDEELMIARHTAALVADR